MSGKQLPAVTLTLPSSRSSQSTTPTDLSPFDEEVIDQNGVVEEIIAIDVTEYAVVIVLWRFGSEFMFSDFFLLVFGDVFLTDFSWYVSGHGLSSTKWSVYAVPVIHYTCHGNDRTN